MTGEKPGNAGRKLPSGISKGPGVSVCSPEAISPPENKQPNPTPLAGSDIGHRAIFDEMANGFAVHEIVRDSAAKPGDFKFLAVNPAFAEMTGIEPAGIIGQTVSELLPDTPPGWIDTYAAVAMSGKPGRFEYFSRRLDRHYDVSVYRTTENQLAAMFTDITETKKNLESLRHSRRQFANAQRIAQVGGWEADLETREETWSDETYRILGYEVGEVTPGVDAVLARVHPEDRGKFAESVKQAANKGVPAPYEFRVLLPDGDLRHVSSQMQRYEDPDTGRTTLIGTIADLTQMKSTENALRISEERFRLAMENLPATFTIKDAKLRYLFLNRMFQAWHKTTADQVLGKTAGDFAAPEIAEAFDTLDREVLETGRNIEREVELTYPDGKIRSTIGMKFPIRGADGEIAAIGGYAIDITSRVRAEQALKESEQRYRELIRSSPVPIIVHADQKIVIINARAAEALGGTDPSEFLGRSIWEFVHPTPVHTANRRIEQPYGKPTSEPPPFDRALSAFGERFIRRDGTEFAVEIAAGTVDFEGVTATQIAFNDISERKKAEETARVLQAELARIARVRSMVEMATNFAHELNQPLAAINNYAIGTLRRIRSGGGNIDDFSRVLELVSEQSRRAAQIIRRVRRFVAKDEAEFRPVDLNDAIRQSIVLIEGETAENRVSVELKLGDSVPSVVGDVVQIQQVVLNLVRNGIEAMADCTPATRVLTIETSGDEPGHAVVCVRDAGHGIEPADLEKLFDPFHSTKPGGLGMGLSICRTIVEGHGGKIKIEQQVTKGTVVRVSFPTDQIAD